MKKNMFAIAVALLSLGAVFFILNDRTTLFAKSGSNTDSAKVTDETKLIHLSIGSGDTKVVTSDAEEVRVEFNGKGKMKLEDKGDEINLSVKKKEFFSFSFGRKGYDTIVYLPQGYSENVEISLGSGDLVFSPDDAMSLQNMKVVMGSGDMKIGNFDTESFTYKGSSGDFVAKDIKTKKGNLVLNSGDVLLTGFEGPLKGTVSSGDLSVSMKKLTGDVDFTIGSGDVDLKLPKDANFKLNGNASSGDILSTIKLQDKTTTEDSIKGTKGTGEHSINVDLTSGDMIIR
ncbi:DUF4097 family beta strand repeat-containing protein [Rossellomorea marisflavi]|uniref:DUF4097 family beta strand repeat-containing protein n=1 Tax=Rossellomorea marisflavi TaxID=189381 RepID=UPI0009A662B0|nr:DUF4097 family beta strand repeat-containing protein [Rossellomorea marisflavi]